MTDEEKINELCKYHHMNCDWFEEALGQMAKWKEQQMIERACELYRSELKQFERLLIAYDKNAFTNLIDFEGTINDFKRGLEIEMLDNED